MRILIADNDEGFRIFIRRVLVSEKDWTVVGEATDGEEAIRKVQKLQPDLVLMDMCLPAIDGLEATRRIKGDIPRTSVIMFSSLDGLAFREASARSGADEFLPKFAPLPMILATMRKSSSGTA